MSLMCCYDEPDYRIDLHWPVVSTGTETCVECRTLIHPGEEHYSIRLWRDEWNHPYSAEWDGELEVGRLVCCEVCGDLALSVMEKGYCWSFGDLRNDIQEMKEL